MIEDMDNKLSVCQACLSKDRELFPIRKLQDLLTNVDLVDLNLNYEGGLCWECKKIILKFSRFKKQAELAQISLHQIEELQSLKSFSKLSCVTSVTYSYPATPDPDNSETIDSPKQTKQETEDTIDNSDCDDEKPIFEPDVDIHEHEIKTEDINLEENKRVKNLASNRSKVKKLASSKSKAKQLAISRIKGNGLARSRTGRSKVKELASSRSKVNKTSNKNKSVDHDNVKDKFILVELTEEELIKSREEKRSHPNFKKLPYNCDSCVLGFTRKENYDTHMEKKHNEKLGLYICPVCQMRFATPATVAKHVGKHYYCYRCKLCLYETSELQSALSHVRSKHNGDSEDCIHCKQCDYVAKGREEMTEHTKSAHPLICNECGEKFNGPNTLKAHMRRIHSTAREHKCEACPRAFRSRGRLEAHMTSHGPAAAARVAYCALCRVQYKNLYVYRNHLATSANHSERRYHCEECGNKFASKIYYKRHYAFYHQKESKFKCELCDRLFISAWRLRNHKQMRHGAARARNHACDQCGNKFYTASTLRAHQLTHSSQRSFMCSDCGDTFKQRPALYTHTRLVHRGLKRHNTT